MIELKHVSKSYEDLEILNDVSFTLPHHGFIGIYGESGCGKTTLLYILGGLLDIDKGKILYNGKQIEDREEFIRNNVSFMMQNHDDIEALNVKENIILPTLIAQRKYLQKDFEYIITQLQISHLLNRKPSEISIGQRKRVSLAKSLLKNTPLLLCDEPTGALHDKQSRVVMSMLKEYSKESLVVVVSHDYPLIEKYCDALLELKNGKIQGKIQIQDYEVTKTNTYKKSFLNFYSFKQFLHQKNKLISLLLFQSLLITCFLLMFSAILGFYNQIHRSEQIAPLYPITKIEKKNNEPFLEPPVLHQAIQLKPYYHFENLSCSLDISSIEVLPQQLNHLSLLQGQKPINENEVIVSYSLKDYYQKNIEIKNHNEVYQMKVVGVLNKDFFENKIIYCLSSFCLNFPLLKDESIYCVESSYESVHEDYIHLQKDYHSYNDIIERTMSYQSLLSFSQIVASLFMGISLCISFFFIQIVESIIFSERKHDIAYLLSLGMVKNQLLRMSIKEGLILGCSLCFCGYSLFYFIYFFLNDIYHLKEKIGFSLMIKPVLLFPYDLFVFLTFIYLLLASIGMIIPIMKVKRNKYIEILRED